jgi:hypothetical protein
MAQKKKKKKPQAPAPQQMSPKKYIETGRARLLPIGDCLISNNREYEGLCTVIVPRRHVTGNITFGVYLLDVFCLGLKNTHALFNYSIEEYEEMVAKLYDAHLHGYAPCSYELAHNLIYGAIAYASKLGFKPHKDWALSQMILQKPNTVEPMDLDFGKDGKPFFINGPYDNVTAIVNQLNKSVGEGNYDFTYMVDHSSYFNDNYYDDDEDDYDDEDDNIEETEYEEVK